MGLFVSVKVSFVCCICKEKCGIVVVQILHIQKKSHGSPVTIDDRRIRLSTVTFLVCLNCFTTSTSQALLVLDIQLCGCSQVITLDSFQRFYFEITFYHGQALLHMEHHASYCLHCALRTAHARLDCVALDALDL
jgi:hypothetical protein